MSLLSATSRVLRLITFVLVFFSLTAARPARAQQLSAITGQVRDESGAVLPGVTVKASSPVLQLKEVSDVTNAQGEYRITPLPIGIYAVLYTLDGFTTMRQEAVRLDLGATVRLDVTLKLGALSETLTVSGAAPVVDVTATSASTQFTRETLELTPTSRNGAISLMVQAPGVRAPGRLDVGGGTVGDTPEFSSFGQPIESFMVMEGLVTSDSRIQTQGGNYFDYNAMEEAKVQTISNGPDVPSRGPALSMLLKSGGNQFHGGASYAYSSQHTEGDNVDDELRAQGITEGNPLLSRTDQGGDFGGRIIRDKLWFYGSARYRPQDVIQLGVFKPDGTPGNGYKAEIITNQKISYQPRQASKLVFWNTWVQKYHYADTQTRFQAWESRLDRIPPIRVSTWKTEWQEVRGNSLVMSFLFGRWTWTGGQNANFVGTTDAATAAGVPQGLEIRMGNDESHGGGRPSRFDQTSQWQDGQSPNGGSWNDIWRYTSKATATYFKPDLFKGNHEFKAGFEYTPNRFIQGNGDREVIAPTDAVPEAYRESMRWNAAQLTPAESQLLASWPLTCRSTVDGLGDVLFCHATPRNDTEIFTRQTADERLLPIFGALGVPLAVCGHTHMQFDRTIGTVRVVNAGSVGMPFGEPGAYWLLLGPGVELRRTSYDLAAAAERIRATAYPKADEFAERNVLQPPSEQEILAAFGPAELK